MIHRPWSFSSLTLYETCGYRYKLKYIDKQPEPIQDENNAAVRGNRVHEGIENYLNSKSELPEEAKSLEAEYQSLVSLPLTIEEDWGFDRDWNSVDSWQHPDISCRMKLDVFYQTGDTCVIGDHKTGKVYDLKHMQQAQLYAVGARAKFPQLLTFGTKFWYVDQGITKQHTFNAAQVDRFKITYQRRIDKLWNDEHFKPISNKYNCKWCPFGPEGTAVCEFRSEE